MDKKYQFTEKVHTQWEEAVSPLRSFYCREDAQEALRKLNSASRTTKVSRTQKLQAICSALGLDYREVVKNPKLLEQVPTQKELGEQLGEIFHNLYRKLPGSADYMERIVRRLAPEYAQDPVRVAILKKYLAAGEMDSTKAVRQWALEHLTAEEAGQYPTLSEEAQTALLVSKIDDSIFSPEHMSSVLTAKTILQLLVYRMENLPKGTVHKKGGKPGQPLLKPAAAKALAEYCAEISCTALTVPHKLQEIVQYLEAHPDAPQPDAMAALVEKDCAAWLRSLRYINQLGREAKVFELYRNNKRDMQDAQSASWKILKLCNDFAQGTFRNKGVANREDLYQFALVFRMTAALMPGDRMDPVTDLQKNLFEDFYSDNLLRYLDAQTASSGDFEKEPSGDGINFKNYVEVLYLYYLYHQELKLTPAQRIRRVSRQAEACRKLTKGQSPAAVVKCTEAFLERMPRVLLQTEKDLPQFLADNYPVPSVNGASAMTAASQTVTAYDTAENALNKLMEDQIFGTLDTSYMNDGTWSKDEVKAERSNRPVAAAVSRHFSALLHQKYAEEPDFLRVVDALEERLAERPFVTQTLGKSILLQLLWLLQKQQPGELISMQPLRSALAELGTYIPGDDITMYCRILSRMGFSVERTVLEKGGDSHFCLTMREYLDDDLNDLLDLLKEKTWDACQEDAMEQIAWILQKTSAQRLTRSELLSILAQRYMSDFYDVVSMRSFPEVYNAVVPSLSEDLQDARFQPFSEKNILDMYVLLALYFQIVHRDEYA